ncbi:MAG TPA: peptide-N4-asparagine amidase [Lysobacter sp.]|nr:peptide-N4-asparagine amidase [Lysobacter sp.]
MTAAAIPLDPALAGADPLTVEPRVPRAAGTPCVVELVRNTGFTRSTFAEPFFYMPPPACPGPWAKVLLVVELTGERPPRATSANIEITLNNDLVPGGVSPGTVFVGAPQENARTPLWRLERDITHLASALTAPQTGYLLASDDNPLYDDDYLPIGARTARLLFYPASVQTPAQRTPDAVYALAPLHATDATPRAAATLTLPRNVERAYLDVTAQALGGAQRFWFACVPQAAASAHPTLLSKFALGDAHARMRTPTQGCTGGSFREVEIRIDGQRAGLAPLFPWLPSTLHPQFGSALDDPAPGVQALNFMPFRVDLTPFAALLSDGAPHTVEAVVVAGEPAGTAYVTGQLLLYLDRGRVQVTGAVTRNTLAAQPAAPNVRNELRRVEETVDGRIITTARRDYVIEGYVDTSRGRIHSRVWQSSRFANTQTFRVSGHDPATLWWDDPYKHDYLQTVRLSSTLDRGSRRTLRGVLLAEDREFVSYPLILDYRHAGMLVPGEFGDTFISHVFEAEAHQARGVRAAHVRPGMPPYRTALADVFDARHAWQRTDTAPGARSTRASRRSYGFTDTFGSCYAAMLATADGQLTERTRGTTCPGSRNALRWYAHADGSPDGLDWARQR